MTIAGAGAFNSKVSPVHLVSAQSAIMLTDITMVGLLGRPKRRLFKTVGWASLFIFSIYILNMSVLYLQHE